MTTLPAGEADEHSAVRNYVRDLILGRDTTLTGLPWVGHRSPSWEPEPLRWLGVNAGLRTMALADREEQLTRRPSVLQRSR